MHASRLSPALPRNLCESWFRVERWLRGGIVMPEKCSVSACERLIGAHGARGMCSMHYKRWSANGDPSIRRFGGSTVRPVKERFWEKVDKRDADECWEWTGNRGSGGYGQFWVEGRTRRATRVLMSFLLGSELPVDVLVCHSCDNPPCVNPTHLFLGSHAANAADRDAKGRHGSGNGYQFKTHCKNGHPFALTARMEGASRRCVRCKSEYDRAFRMRQTERREVLTTFVDEGEQ